MSRHLKHIEDAFRKKAPMELGIVHAERMEATASCYLYYTRDDEDNKESWFVARMDPESILNENFPWEDIVHIDGPPARVWIEQQYAIWEFLEEWAHGLRQGRRLFKHIHAGLKIPKEPVLYLLTARQCIDRVGLARQFIQNHLLSSQVDG